MRKIPDEAIKKVEESLDERWQIIENHNRNEDRIYYEGFTNALTQLGFDWERKDDGTHRVHGNT